MIKLKSEDRTYFSQTISKRFPNLGKSKVEEIIDDIVNTLLGKSENLFYKLRHSIYFYNNIELSNNIFLCTMDIYTYLYDKSATTSKKEFLTKTFINFHDRIYYDNCKERIKTERRSETVHSILKHVSNNLNTMLNTQQLMIANISHEMRTSLNAISGYLTLINEEHILDQNTQLFLERAINASVSLQSLVSDILDISKINSDQMEIKNSYFWLDEVIIHSIDQFMLQIKEKELRFKSDVSFFPYQVSGDAQRIMEILTNLLNNAGKFTEKGFIHLTVEKLSQKDDEIEISFKVKDTGAGMSQEQIKNIFDPYTRFQNNIQGVGLGLYISKKLAQNMGGRLTVRSEVGKGSTFEFKIKLKQKLLDPVDFKKKKIYFFNDLNDEDKRNIFDQKLKLIEKLGANIQSFNDDEFFTDFLLYNKSIKDSDEVSPDIISITTTKNNYAKYDALINYLKNFEKYQNTYFIAEQTLSRLPLNYFNKSFERFATLSTYIKALNVYKKKDQDNTLDHKIRILAVDDIQSNLEILKLFIQKKYPDITLDLATSGYEAIDMYKVHNYDLIFLDLKMPSLDGFGLLKELRTIKTTPMTFALTADVYKNTYEKVISAGFNGLLEKPLQVDLLYQTIEEVSNV